MPVGRIGFPLALPEMVPLLQLVGPAVAAELLLANRLFDAPEAAAKGLVQRVLDAAQFEPALAELLRGVRAGSPLAARLNKEQIRLLLDQRMRYTQHDLDASLRFSPPRITRKASRRSWASGHRSSLANKRKLANKQK